MWETQNPEFLSLKCHKVVKWNRIHEEQMELGHLVWEKYHKWPFKRFCYCYVLLEGKGFTQGLAIYLQHYHVIRFIQCVSMFFRLIYAENWSQSRPRQGLNKASCLKCVFNSLRTDADKQALFQTCINLCSCHELTFKFVWRGPTFVRCAAKI